MIAHVVFDLPLEDHFDYLIPDEFNSLIVPGMRVKVLLGTKTVVGFVVSVVKDAQVAKLKPIKKPVDAKPVFGTRDLEFGRRFAAYYGCSLGEALATLLRQRTSPLNEIRQKTGQSTDIYHCPD